jgi:hypothetical protein
MCAPVRLNPVKFCLGSCALRRVSPARCVIRADPAMPSPASGCESLYGRSHRPSNRSETASGSAGRRRSPLRYTSSTRGSALSSGASAANVSYGSGAEVAAADFNFRFWRKRRHPSHVRSFPRMTFSEVGARLRDVSFSIKSGKSKLDGFAYDRRHHY